MTLDASIPTLFSARLRAHLDKRLVAAQPGVVNRDYEGEIRRRGDKVTVSQIGPITIGTYVKNTDINVEDVDSGTADLEITESEYFAFQVDDVDATQTGLAVVDNAAQRAAYGLGDSADAFVLAAMRADGSSASSSASDEYEKLVDLWVALEETSTPRASRFAICPPAFYGGLLKDDRFVGSGAASADARLLNGIVGQAAGFDILVSNNIVTGSGDDGAVIAGHPLATSYADQISKVEAFRLEKRFADGLKGLHLYGVKVFEPDALAILEL